MKSAEIRLVMLFFGYSRVYDYIAYIVVLSQLLICLCVDCISVSHLFTKTNGLHSDKHVSSCLFCHDLYSVPLFLYCEDASDNQYMCTTTIKGFSSCYSHRNIVHAFVLPSFVRWIFLTEQYMCLKPFHA